jgi:hypothetical protein
LFQFFHCQGLLLNKIFNFQFEVRFPCWHSWCWILKWLKNMLYLQVHFINCILLRNLIIFLNHHILPSHYTYLIFIKFVISYNTWFIAWLNQIIFIILQSSSSSIKFLCILIIFLESLQWILCSLNVVIRSEDNRIFSQLYLIILFCLLPALD